MKTPKQLADEMAMKAVEKIKARYPRSLLQLTNDRGIQIGVASAIKQSIPLVEMLACVEELRRVDEIFTKYARYIDQLERELNEAREALGNANREAQDYKDSYRNEFEAHKQKTERLSAWRKVADELAATLDKFKVKWDDEKQALAAYEKLKAQ